LTKKVKKYPNEISGNLGTMAITPKKNQYALRAIFELAKHRGKGPQKISQIAQAQAIPVRFLEVILGQLKASGWVDSKRGFYGGYYLKSSPREISVGDIIRFLQSSPNQIDCVACISKGDCPYDGKCAFASMWNQVNDAMFKIYNETTIQDLINNEKEINRKKQPGET
jgi:Rrf2 family protein